MNNDQRNYQYDELVEIGQHAAALLNSPVYQMAYQAVLEDLQRRFFATEPGHTRSLEELRREGNALAKVQQNLIRAISQAEQIITTQRGE